MFAYLRRGTRLNTARGCAASPWPWPPPTCGVLGWAAAVPAASAAIIPVPGRRPRAGPPRPPAVRG